MRYLMLIADTEAAHRLSEPDFASWMSEIVAWYDKHAGDGTLVDSGHELQRPHTAKTIRGNAVFDGPFIETKEILGGYTVLEADTIDEAVEFAMTWPGVDRGYVTIEIRPTVVH